MPSSQTELAVLAVLSIRPATGYAIRATLAERLTGFWSESFGQIYPAISRLQAAGLVVADDGARSGSVVLSLTDTGRDHLLDLLRTPPVPARPRNGTLLRLFFGQVQGPEACAALVAGARQRAEDQLAELAAVRVAVEAERADGGIDDDQACYQLMTVSAGEHSARAALAWADETLAGLTRLTERTRARTSR